MPFETVTIGPHTLYLGCCLEVLPTLGKVDAVVTDPPYGVEFTGKNTKHTKRSDEGYISGDSDIGPSAVAKALEISSRGVVFPGNRMMFDYPKPYEFGCVFCPSGAGLGRWGFTTQHAILFYGMGLPHTRQGPSGFTSFDTVEPNGHPCPKPLRWMEWAIEKCSLPGHVILEPFMGSGTTIVACQKLGRVGIGIEKEPKYFDIACKRIEAEMNRFPMFETPVVKQSSLLEGVA